MPVRKVIADARVEDAAARPRIMRGPIVYCVEGRDADESLGDLSLGKNGLAPAREPSLLGGVVTVPGPGFTAIPYCTWANRGAGPMKVWLRNVRRGGKLSPHDIMHHAPYRHPRAAKGP